MKYIILNITINLILNGKTYQDILSKLCLIRDLKKRKSFLNQSILLVNLHQNNTAI